MKQRIFVFGFVILLLSISTLAADSDRRHVVLDQSAARSAFPFSDAVLVGNTLYLAGTVGFDKTGKPPAAVEEEVRLAMESVKRVLESQGMAMDDLVSVQVYCTDFGLYDKFNGVYRTYFQEQFPARAFVGVASLIRGAHFELTGIAVKRPK
jgi:2-iminobutanoate/2-iminopropanoate deaminase